MKIVYLNGAFLPPEQAQVSVLDRGFLFGDGVYEVIPVYNQRLFRVQEHLARLQKSLSAIRLEINISEQAWVNIFAELVTKNLEAQGENQAIYLQITRGYAPERSHLFPQSLQPTIFAQTMPFKILPLATLDAGMSAITLPDTRWQQCFIKAIALLPNVLFYQQAKDAGVHEAILIRDGEVTEASTSNIFIVEKGVIKTPPLSPYLLGGITRDFILELAQTHHKNHEVTVIKETQLRHADEVWVTSSTKEIYPIVKLDNKPVGAGVPGPVWRQMIKIYRDYIKDFSEG